MSPTPDQLKQIFGHITPVGPLSDPVTGLSTLIIVAVRLFLFLGFLAAFFYMMWGAFDWITSGGDKEGISKAQGKIRDAVVGLIAMVIVLSLVGIVAGDILGVIKKNPDGNWIFMIPQIGGKTQCVANNSGCTTDSMCCSGTCKPVGQDGPNAVRICQ